MDLEKLLIGIQKKIERFFIFISRVYSRFHLEIKIKGLLKKSPKTKLSKENKNKIKSFFSKYGISYINYDWHNYYSSNSGSFSEKYIPEDIFFARIEPALNKYKEYPGLRDKNLTSKLFKNISQPKWLLKNINGFLYSNNNTPITLDKGVELCSKLDQFIIKPSLDSGCGKNVALFKNNLNDVKQNKRKLFELLDSYDKDYIVESFIVSHEGLKIFNESSVNTLRIMSYLNEDGVHILSSIVRFGGPGQLADNSGDDTIGCGIDENGLIKRGFDFKGTVFLKNHNEVELKGLKVPQYQNILNIVKDLHVQLPYFRINSWDVTVNSNDEIIVIEYNPNWQDINSHQLNNGPLLEPFTDEILKIAQDFWKNL